jgi:hypothetical protein
MMHSFEQQEMKMTKAEMTKVEEMQRALVQAEIALHTLAIACPRHAASANAVAAQCRKAKD